MRKRISILAAILVILLGLGGFLYIYQRSYYRNTKLTIGAQSLDWYAYREFDSDLQLYFYVPMYHWEHRQALRDFGYSVIPTVAKKSK